MLLTREQIIELTGYKRPGKQVAALRLMGVKHFVRLDGHPVVDDSALSTKVQQAGAQPAWERINE